MTPLAAVVRLLVYTPGAPAGAAMNRPPRARPPVGGGPRPNLVRYLALQTTRSRSCPLFRTVTCFCGPQSCALFVTGSPIRAATL
jgi:hypothetical protein